MGSHAVTRDDIVAQRDHQARLCADLLHRGHVHEARRAAREAERYAVMLRTPILVTTTGAA